jgi:hypothetical protein
LLNVFFFSANAKQFSFTLSATNLTWPGRSLHNSTSPSFLILASGPSIVRVFKTAWKEQSSADVRSAKSNPTALFARSLLAPEREVGPLVERHAASIHIDRECEVCEQLFGVAQDLDRDFRSSRQCLMLQWLEWMAELGNSNVLITRDIYVNEG